MFLTIEDTYRDRKIELTETPPGIHQARVIVTFLTSDEAAIPSRRMRYGQFTGHQMSTDEDFKLAKWRGETEEQDGA